MFRLSHQLPPMCACLLCVIFKDVYVRTVVKVNFYYSNFQFCQFQFETFFFSWSVVWSFKSYTTFFFYLPLLKATCFYLFYFIFICVCVCVWERDCIWSIRLWPSTVALSLHLKVFSFSQTGCHTKAEELVCPTYLPIDWWRIVLSHTFSGSISLSHDLNSGPLSTTIIAIPCVLTICKFVYLKLALNI